jgi:hypothetical protein
VGRGDFSVINFLSSLLCKPTAPNRSFTSDQSFRLGTYLIYQAKKHISGCGGDTEILVLRPNGHYDNMSGKTKELEAHIIEIEDRLSIAASMSFDVRVSDDALDQNWALVLNLIKRHRQSGTTVTPVTDLSIGRGTNLGLRGEMRQTC